MTRRSGGFRGAKPTWTTTSTSGIFGMEDVIDLKAANQWPRGPVAPTSLAGTGGDQQVALTWTAPATTHGTITDYVVEYTPAAGSPTVVATGSTAASYTLTGLTNDTEYTFRVAAVNHTPGDWSGSISLTPASFQNYSATTNGSTTHPASGLYEYSGVYNGKPYWARYANGSPNAYISWTEADGGNWIAGSQLATTLDPTVVWFKKLISTESPPLSGWDSFGYGGTFILTVT